MPQLQTFNKALETFKTGTKPLAPSNLLIGLFTATKTVIQTATEMDAVAGKTSAEMIEAMNKYEEQLNLWLLKLEKQVKAEKSPMPMKTELTKFQRSLALATLDYKGAATKLQEQEANAPGQAGTKVVQTPIIAEAVTKANEMKLAAAIKNLKEMRARELKSTEDLRKKMTQDLQLLTNLRGNAEKTLAAAALDATNGQAVAAGQKALVVAKMAADAEKQATGSQEHLDKTQKEFMPFRDGLNWGKASKTFDLTQGDVASTEKTYGQELVRQIPVFNKIIKLGGECWGVVKTMTQVANEIASMAELCTAYGQDANALRQVVLKDLTDPSGTTCRASFDDAMTGDKKRSVTKLVEKVTSAIKSIELSVKNYMSAKDTDKKALAKEAVAGNWGLLNNAVGDLKDSFARAEQALEAATQRVPKSLEDDGEVKQALLGMATPLVENEKLINPLLSDFGKLELLVQKLKLDTY